MYVYIDLLVNFLKGFLQFVLNGQLWGLVAINMTVGTTPILMYLVATGHAKPGPKRYKACPDRITCWDERFWKAAGLLGGSVALTFGLGWYISGLLVPAGWVRDLLFSFAKLGFLLSLVSEALLVVVLRTAPDKRFVYWVSPHLKGCGYDTAISPLWPLFWLQQIVKRLANGEKSDVVDSIVIFRDIVTLVMWVISIPFVIASNIVTLPFAGKLVLPGAPLMPDE